MEIKLSSAQELEEKYLSLSFTKHTGRPHVIVNMVMSADGSVTVINSKTGQASERGLGSKVDQRMMRILRFHADGTLNGAETLRISGSGSEIEDSLLQERRRKAGKPENPIACILTRNAENLPLESGNEKSGFFYSADFEAVVFTTNKANKENIQKIRETKRHVEVLPDTSDNVKEMLNLMFSKYRVKLLLCEGGPTINGSLLKNGLVDEIFITMSMKIVGGGKSPFELHPPFTAEVLAKISPTSVYYVEETNEFFFHYKVSA